MLLVEKKSDEIINRELKTKELEGLLTFTDVDRETI
jgi:hypothetical protein